MSPNEFLWDCTFGYIAKVLEERPILEVHVQAIAKAMVRFAIEDILVHSEGKLDFASAPFEALQGLEAHFLGKAESSER